MKITNEQIEAMLAASPGSTAESLAESLAEGFERRAERMGEMTVAWSPGPFGPIYAREAAQDKAMALALRAYALQKARAVYSLAAVAGGASFHGARFDDIQLPPASGGAL